MIIIRLFFIIVCFSFILMFGLGIMVWLRLRLLGLSGIFKQAPRPQEPESRFNNENVIEGEYTVIPPAQDTKKP